LLAPEGLGRESRLITLAELLRGSVQHQCFVLFNVAPSMEWTAMVMASNAGYSKRRDATVIVCSLFSTGNLIMTHL
jgi:hypothetical protein